MAAGPQSPSLEVPGPDSALGLGAFQGSACPPFLLWSSAGCGQTYGQWSSCVPPSPCHPDPEAPLGAWGRGHTPAFSQGPFPVKASTGIRGLGSGVNSICLCSFQAMNRSVLPATSNFLDKGSAEELGGEPAKQPWESPGTVSTCPT